MKGKLSGMAILVACLLAVAPVASAQETPCPKVYSSISVDEAVAILNGLGINPEKSKDSDGKPMFVFRLGNRTSGYRVGLYFFNEKGDGRFAHLNLSCIFDNKNNTFKEEHVNVWNRARRFCSAYIDKKQNMVFRGDLNVVGVTEQNIKEFIQLFEASLNRFVVEIFP